MTAMGHDGAVAERLCAEQSCEDLRGHLGLLQCSIAADGVESMEQVAEATMLEFPPPDPVLAVALPPRRGEEHAGPPRAGRQ